MKDYAENYLLCRRALEAFYAAAALSDWPKASAKAQVAVALAIKLEDYADDKLCDGKVKPFLPQMVNGLFKQNDRPPCPHCDESHSPLSGAG